MQDLSCPRKSMTVTWCMQGTFLPAKAAVLDRMGRHTELLEAGYEIRRGTAGLRSHKLLRIACKL